MNNEKVVDNNGGFSKFLNFFNNHFHYCMTVLLMFGIIAVILIPFNQDFFLIYNAGREIVEIGAVPTENYEFVLDGYKTIIQQWLYSVTLYSLCNVFGNTAGCYILMFIQSMMYIIGLYLFARLKDLDKRLIFLLIPLTFLMNYSSNSIRPFLISNGLLMLQIDVFEYYKKTNKKGILWFLPLIFLAEINLHCTFWLVHFVFLLPYFVPYPFKTKYLIKDSLTLQQMKSTVLPLLISFGMLFINPYGIDGITILLKTGECSHFNITEMKHPYILSFEGVIFLFTILMAFYLLLKKKLSSVYFFFVLGLGFMQMLYMRNASLFNIIVFGILVVFAKGLKFENVEPLLNKLHLIIYIIGVPMFLLIFILLPFDFTEHVKYTDQLLYPSKAISYLLDNEKDLSSLKVYTPFNSGSSFVYNGLRKVYLTPRAEPYCEDVNEVESIMKESLALKSSSITPKEIDNFLDKYDFDYLMVDFDAPTLSMYLQLSEDYECVVEEHNDKNVVIYRLFKKVS